MSDARTIKAARALYARSSSPSLAAYNKSRQAKSERARVFWLGVGRFLFMPHRCQGWTQGDYERWALIRGGAA